MKKKKKNKKRYIRSILEVFKTAVMTMDTVNTILGGLDKWRGLY